MSDEIEQGPAGPPDDPAGHPVSSPAPPPPAEAAPVAAAPGPSRRERLRRAGGRRSVQLLAAGLIGGIVGGAVVGLLGAVSGDDGHHPRRYAEYGRYGGPFMRGDGPNWRYRGQDGGGLPGGGPGWYGPWSGKVPGQGGQPAYPVPAQPAPAVPSPASPSPTAKAT
jgi:hypothetical protein